MIRAMLHIIWKDYRAILPFWLSVAALGMLMQLGVVLFEDQDAASLEPLFTTTLVFIALYGLGCGAALFAGESEDGTRELLRTLPLSPTPLLTGKLILAVLSLAAMVVALFGSAAYMNSQFLGRIQMAKTEYIFVASGLAWGILFSICSARPLTAACLGAAGAVLANYIVMGVVGMTMKDSFWWQGVNAREQLLLHSLPACSGILLVVILIDIVAGLGWLNSDPSSSRSGLSWSVSKGRSVGRLGWAASKWGWAVSRRAASITVVIHRPARSAIWARLAWVHVQQMARIWTVIGGLGLLFVMLAIQINQPGSSRNFLNVLGPVIVGIVTVFGASVFVRDQEQSQFRFFANHGVSPRDFWWVRQIVGLSVVGLWMLSVWVVCGAASLKFSAVDFSQYFFVDIYDRWTPRRTSVIPIKSETLAAILQFSLLGATAYSVGQFCSLAIRKGIAAVAGGLMLGIVLSAWVVLMIYCEISLLLSVLPIPFIFLFASRVRVSQWLVDRGGLRCWTRVALSIVIPLTAMIANMGYQRANGISVINSSNVSVDSPLNKINANPYQGEFLRMNLSKYSRPVTAEERKTAEMYRDIRSVLVPYSRITAEYKERGKKDGTEYTGRWFGNYDFSPFKVPTVSDEAIAWIDRNEQAIEQLLVVTERNACVLFNPVTDDTDLTRDSLYGSLEQLLLGSGRVLTDRGEFDAAWKSYRALIRYSVHRNQRSPWIRGRYTRETVYYHLAYWASRPGQTVERIREVMEQLDELDQFEPSLKDHIGYNYVLMCRIADGDVGAMLLCNEQINPTFFSVASEFLPWERQRARHALARQYDHQLEQSGILATRIAGGVNNSTLMLLREPDLILPVGALHYENQRGLLGHDSFLLKPFTGGVTRSAAIELIQREIERRGVRLQLAISAWRIEHGTLPETLAELVPDYFDKEPLDPVTGQSFGYVRLDTYPKSQRQASNDVLYEKKNQVVLADNFVWSVGLYLTCDTKQRYGIYEDDLHGGVEDADGNLVDEDQQPKRAWWRAYRIPGRRGYSYGEEVSSELELYRYASRFSIFPLNEEETCAALDEKCRAGRKVISDKSF